MEYPPQMHHQMVQPCKPAMHQSQHPLLSNQLQPINSDTHTSMWLDDPYTYPNVCLSQRDSGFNSRPASLRSIESTSTGHTHHGPTTSYEHISPALANDVENRHFEYADMHPGPSQAKPEPAQVIPELISLLMEDDPVIVREAVTLTNLLIKEGGDRRLEVIRNRELIHALLETFGKDMGDGKTTDILASLFFSLSQQQESLRVIFDCGGIGRLLQIFEIFNSSNNAVKFTATTLHNFLIVLQDQAANEIERCDGIQKFINLLESTDDKLLTLVSDSLLKMSNYSSKAKIFLQNNEQVIQRLLYIFDTSQYKKLLLIISRLLPVVSSGSEIMKRIILQFNGLHILEKHLRTAKSIRIQHNCLITLRNISSQATRMRDVDSLIQQLSGILLTNDHESVLYSMGILSNLTADNRINKSLLVKLNGVQTLVEKLIMNTDDNDDFIEATLCTLRNITARHDLENEARETIKRSYGIGNIVKLLRDKNFKDHWEVIKAVVGLIKNLALSSTIIPYLSEQNTVRKLLELLINIDRERVKLPDESHRYDSLTDSILGALVNLSEDVTCQATIKEMNCTSIFIRLSQLPSCSVQQTSNILLKQLNLC